jgi:hypothetical protein
VQANNNVHVVLGDGIVRDSLEVRLLLTMVKSRPRNGHPGGVCSRDAEGIDTNRGKLVDGGSVQERSITGLEDWIALCTKNLAQSPLIRSIATANGLSPDRVVSSLLFQPATQICTVGFEGLPVNEFSTVDIFGPDNVVDEARQAGNDTWDLEGALIMVVDCRSVRISVRLQDDTQGLEKLI